MQNHLQPQNIFEVDNVPAVEGFDSFPQFSEDQVSKDIRQFLGVMLPGSIGVQNLRDRYLEVRLIGQDNQVKRHFLPLSFEMETRLVEIVAESMETASQVYVGFAIRNNDKSGKEADCVTATFMVTDFDEINGKKIKDMTDPEEQAQARQQILQRLQEVNEIPPTMIIDSGHGFHAYYALTSAVEVQNFLEAFKSKVRWLNQRYPDMPGDSAMERIAQPIRLPGSFNFKNPDTPRPCKVIAYHPDRRYDFAALPEADLPAKTLRKPIQCVAGSTSKSYKYPFFQCLFLKHLLDNPEKQSYNLWMAAASTLAYFKEDGRVAFHELSRKYPEYQAKEADKLFDSLLVSYQNGVGPVTYDKLAEYGFSQRDQTEAASPAIYIAQLGKETKLAAMGIEIDEDGKLKFNPNLFVEFFQIRYQIRIYENKVFYEYAGGVWRQTEKEEILRQIRDLFQEAKKNIYRNWMGNEVLEMLKVAVPKAPAMNAQRYLINFNNGMFNTDTYELEPHASEHYSTIQIPLAYDPDAKCKQFEKFIEEIMEKDFARIAVLQEIIGYLLGAENIIQIAFFFFGEGANGKSILLEIVTMLLGKENVSNLSLQDLDSPFRRSGLIDKTVNIATENEIDSKGFNSQTFKAAISGDRIVVEKKFQDAISYAPICKFVYAVNNLPYSRDRSHALYRRILIIPFNKRFAGKDDDKHLKKKLAKELPGILNWALAGLKRLRQNGYEFTKSEAIEQAVGTYKKEQNPMLDYMKEMLDTSNPKSRVQKLAVFGGYGSWCFRNGLGDAKKLSAQAFWKTFKANCKELGLPYDEQISNGIRYLRQIEVKPFLEKRERCKFETFEDDFEKLG